MTNSNDWTLILEHVADHPNGAAAVARAQALGVNPASYAGAMSWVRDIPADQLPRLIFDDAADGVRFHVWPCGAERIIPLNRN